MPTADLTPEHVKLVIQLNLEAMRKEYHKVYGAVCFLNPSNTISDTEFEKAYFKIREMLNG